MKPLRFLLQIENSAAADAQPVWKLTVTCSTPGWKRERALRSMAAPDGTFVPLPPADDLPSAAQLDSPLCENAAKILEAFNNIAQHIPGEKEIETFGRYLFSTLIGEKLWADLKAAAAGATTLELALSWPCAERNLHRLNWELMHDQVNFLAKGIRNGALPIRIVITRIIADADAPERKLSLPARLLCVVGSSLSDDRIRPGAELFGLFRQLEKSFSQHSIHTKVLLNATTDKVQQRIKEFRPEIVLIICHGDKDTGKLEFQPEEDDPGAGASFLSASEIAEHLTVDEPAGVFRPAIIVLGACFSGTVGGPAQTAPLAVDLVAEGFPVVVGMTGSVADRSCRLFTRFFGESLLFERSLVEAAERGRRVAFTKGESPYTSADWAYPAIYFSSKVDSGYAPTLGADVAKEKMLKNALKALGIAANENEPVLAARQDLLDEFYRDFITGKTPVLALVGDQKSGKTRLLRELAAQGLRDGHLPVVLDRNADQKGFNLEDFRKDLIQSIRVASTAFEVSTFENGLQLDKLTPNLKTDALPEGLDALVAKFLGTYKEINVPVLLAALRRDLEALLADVKAAPAGVVLQPGARPVLFLDEIQTLPPPALVDFFRDDVHRVLGAFGLGDHETRIIPVAVSLNSSGTTSDAVRVTTESKRSWSRIKVLAPFAPDGEDLFVYTRVLMHVHNRELYDQISDRSWMANWKEAAVLGKKMKTFRKRKQVRGQPGDFLEQELYNWVEDCKNDSLFREANDEDALKELRNL